MNICYYTPHILEHEIIEEILKTQTRKRNNNNQTAIFYLFQSEHLNTVNFESNNFK